MGEKQEMYYEVIDMDSPYLQTNPVYHIINISQRLKRDMKTISFCHIPKTINLCLKVKKF